MFPGGSSYRVLVLPELETITPALLRRIEELVAAGATVVGSPPARSPSLSDYPQCDKQIQDIVQRVWGEPSNPTNVLRRTHGQGEVVFGGELRCGEGLEPRTHPIARAQWIWFPKGNLAAAAPPGQRVFAHEFELDGAERVVAADLEMTADNAFQVWVNDQPALQGDNFHVAYLGASVASLCAAVAIRFVLSRVMERIAITQPV